MAQIWLYAGISEYPRLLNVILNNMSENVLGADNQQGSPLFTQCVNDDPSETTRRIPRISKSLAILLGLLFTDGCVSKKGNSWRIYFAVKSVALINSFRACMIDSFTIDCERVRIGKTQDGLIRAIVNSKEIGNFLTETFGTFRTFKFSNDTLPDAKIPVGSLIESGFVTEFLQAAFSCDGGLCFYPASRKGKNGDTMWLIRTIFLSCAHPQLRTDYIVLLAHVGIAVREVSKDGKIKIETQFNIKRFHEYIGFIHNVEVTLHSKYWNGSYKHEVLREMVSSYDKPSLVYNHARFASR